ncbi:MAG: tRNA (adenosine(37)-N6)-dimethylallyltransferase MiaA [Planctomycetota bacterium]
MTSQPFAHDCWFLAGATAVGKTEVALLLAERLGAEIVSLDSMAVYRGMDIGTAKPGPDERSRVAHHLVDVVDPDEEFSVARYLQEAEAVVESIRGRGREVLFVGGTPLYLKALLRGMESGPAADWGLREQLEREVAEVGSAALHERLEHLDPIAASQIHANDTRRLIRALEVYRTTGQPISHAQLQFEDGRPAEECRVFVLRRERAHQHDRIEQRVDSMIERGLVEEVRGLAGPPSKLGRTASQAVGYKDVLEHFRGETGFDEMVEKIKARSRRFAKRQGTWFRSLSECRFVDLANDSDLADTAAEIAAAGASVG